MHLVTLGCTEEVSQGIALEEVLVDDRVPKSGT